MAFKLIKPEWEAWDRLRGFGSSRLVQATIVMPIIGYVILFNNDLAAYFKLFFDSESAPDIPWRLYFLYFGFCFLSAGSVLFAYKWPREVKHHGNAYMFIANEERIIHEERLTAMREKLLRNYYDRFRSDCGYNYIVAADFRSETPDEKLQAVHRNMRSAAQELAELKPVHVLMEWFEVMEEVYPNWRRATFLCYAAGVALLAVPTVHTFYRVVVSLA